MVTNVGFSVVTHNELKVHRASWRYWLSDLFWKYLLFKYLVSLTFTAKPLVAFIALTAGVSLPQCRIPLGHTRLRGAQVLTTVAVAVAFIRYRSLCGAKPLATEVVANVARCRASLSRITSLSLSLSLYSKHRASTEQHAYLKHTVSLKHLSCSILSSSPYK